MNNYSGQVDHHAYGHDDLLEQKQKDEIQNKKAVIEDIQKKISDAK